MPPKRALIIIVVIGAVVLIYLSGKDQHRDDGSSTGSSTPAAACTMSVTADALNIRAAPETGAPIVGKLGRRDETTATPTVQNGFRKLAENRWAAEEFLKPVKNANCGQ